MSSNPVQSRPLERVASRRNVIRGAAWTTAAVTVVVATPNIAAASHGTPASAAISATRSQNGGTWSKVEASLTAGTHDVSNLQVTISLDRGITTWPTAAGWTKSPSAANPAASMVYNYTAGNLLSGTKATIGPLTFPSDNADAIKLTALFSWGSPTGSVSKSVIPPKGGSAQA